MYNILSQKKLFVMIKNVLICLNCCTHVQFLKNPSNSLKMDLIFNLVEMQIEIVKHLPMQHVVQLAMVNKTFRETIQSDATWNMVLKRDYNIVTSKGARSKYLKESLKVFARQSPRMHKVMTIMELRKCLVNDDMLPDYHNIHIVPKFTKFLKKLLPHHIQGSYLVNPHLHPDKIYDILFNHIDDEYVGLSALGLIDDEKKYILNGCTVGKRFRCFMTSLNGFGTNFTHFENLIYMCKAYENLYWY